MPRSSTIAWADYASLKCVKAARILVVFWFASAVLGVGQRQKNAAKPDVFLVTIDTLRADHVHCYGYESHSDAGTRWSGQRRHSLHSGVYSQSDHQHFAYQHPDRPAAQQPWRHRFCHPSGAHASDSGGHAEDEWLSHCGLHRRGHSRQQHSRARAWIAASISTTTSLRSPKQNRAGAGLNAAAWKSCNTRKHG